MLWHHDQYIFGYFSCFNHNLTSYKKTDKGIFVQYKLMKNGERNKTKCLSIPYQSRRLLTCVTHLNKNDVKAVRKAFFLQLNYLLLSAGMSAVPKLQIIVAHGISCFV